jgi:segregation and condensation protein B
MPPAPRHERTPAEFVGSQREPAGEPGDEPADEPAAPSGDADWSAADLEAEYLRAVETAEQAEFLTGMMLDAYGAPAASLDEPAPADLDTLPEHQFSAADAPGTGPSPAPASGPTAGAWESAATRDAAPLSPRQVLEALLFVGGPGFTNRRLGELLGLAPEQIEESLDQLNSLYAQEDRPYEVRLVDGGWRLQLRGEFEAVRGRVYGQGPREVKLSQSALEMLSLIAYEQPLPRERLADTAQPDADANVRQLIRRDLVAVQRGAGESSDIRYVTTPRFLELFGLRSLHDLPRAEDVRFK